MIDEIQTPSAADVEVLRGSYAKIKLDLESAARDRDAARTELASLRTAAQTVTAERDTLAGKVTEFGQTLTATQKERDDWKAKHGETATALTDVTNKTRERDVIDGLRAAFPGADPTVVRGAFLTAVEDGKAVRYPEKPADAIAALAELLKPTLSRAVPVNGGGPPTTQTAPATKRTGFNAFSIGQRQA